MKKIGIVGIGCISGIYLENITKRFQDIEIVGVCDLIRERAEQAVAKYPIPSCMRICMSCALTPRWISF